MQFRTLFLGKNNCSIIAITCVAAALINGTAMAQVSGGIPSERVERTFTDSGESNPVNVKLSDAKPPSAITISLSDQPAPKNRIPDSATGSQQAAKTETLESAKPTPTTPIQVSLSDLPTASLNDSAEVIPAADHSQTQVELSAWQQGFENSSRRVVPATPAPQKSELVSPKETTVAVEKVQGQSATGDAASDQPVPLKSFVKELSFQDSRQYLANATNKLGDPSKYLAKGKNIRSISVKLQDRKQSKNSLQRRNNYDLELPAKLDLDQSKSSTEFSDVRAPISMIPFSELRQNDRSGLIYEQVETEIRNGDDVNYALLTNSEFIPSSKAWLAPNFAHQPLYFEEKQLEMYGNSLPLQAFLSGAHFFATFPKLPYLMGENSPWECQYTYGNHRPGDCVPYNVYRRPLNRRALLSQALWTSAIVLP